MGKFPKIIIVIFILWGIIFKLSFIFSFKTVFLESMEFTAVVKVVSMKTEKDKSNSYYVKVLSSNLKRSKNTKIILYTPKDVNLKYGDIVKIAGTFSKVSQATNYKGFDYRKYLKQKKIYGSIYSKNIDFLKHESSIVEKMFIFKENFIKCIDQIYPDRDISSFLKGILIGDSSDISNEIEENFRNSSMSHILAISGMHVSYVIIGMNAILDKLVNSKKVKNVILIFLLIVFTIITGGSQSCIRACLMNILLLLSQNLYKKNSFYISFLITFLILIVMNPFNVFAVGMWLSFGGTMSIVLFHKFFVRFCICKFKIKSKILKQFLEIFLVSFSAQILILPIMIYNFNTISLTFFVSNLLIYFLIGPILALGYISVISGLAYTTIGKFLAIFEKFLVVIILKIAEFCSILPFSKIYIATPKFIGLVVYYIIIAIIIFIFNKSKFKVLRFVLSYRLENLIKAKFFKIVISSLTLILAFNLLNFIPSSLKIYFVDVGQRRLYGYKNSTWEKYNY